MCSKNARKGTLFDSLSVRDIGLNKAFKSVPFGGLDCVEH